MSLLLFTQTPAFAADMMDVYRVFYGAADCVLCDADSAQMTHLFFEEGRQYETAFTYLGQSKKGAAPIPKGDALLQKRVQKRLIKQTLYDLLKVITGIHPPWGSLTGIRPTRLFYEQLARGLSMAKAEQTMQTEFDLHRDKAALLSAIVKTQSALPKPTDNQADIYIGIPFCTSLCAYCSFSSGEIGNGKLVAPYLEKLEIEMRDTAALMRDCGLALRALYIGGGTPTSLNEDQFQWLIDRMNFYFPSAVETTVEAGRPDTLTLKKLKTLKSGGVNRISINPQTFNDHTLKLIGRNHSAEDVFNAYEMARDVGLHHINMDIIAGLPGETLRDFKHTLSCIRSLHPESLTVHTLALKRSSRLHLQGAALPDGAMTAGMVALGAEEAKGLGLTPYYLYRQKYMAGNQENVGYAKENHACLYNVDMMEETANILGIGAGAMSKHVYSNESRIERAPNVSDILTYLSRSDEMIKRKKLLWNRE